MTKLLEYTSKSNVSIFSYSGNVSCLYHSGMKYQDVNDEAFVEVYDKSRFPQKILCEILIDAHSQTGKGKLYDCDSNVVPDIYKELNIDWDTANYIYDRNRWLIDVTNVEDKLIMKIDDEHDTYDGQYVYHERIFVNEVLTDIKHYVKDDM